jgi:hypothetical protein
MHPVGTTVGYMDGIPWLAFGAKLASPVLPENWQHIGLWLALCFTLQGWFGARLVAAFTTSRLAIFAGGALFVAAPILLTRTVHEALCAHFLLLAALTLCVRRVERAPRIAPIALPLVAAGIHPYLTVMVLAVTAAAALIWRREGLIGWRGVAWRVGGATAGVVALFALFGYFSIGAGELGARGFGHANAELFTLVNPHRRSWTLPALPVRQGQSEGYGWLGSGVILLGLSAIVLEIRARRRGAAPLAWSRLRPLLVVAALCAIFAMASRPSALGRDLVDLSVLWRPFEWFTSAFRASGRFIWILVYVLVTGAVAVWLARAPRRAPWVLAACLAVQLADYKRVFSHRYGRPRAILERSPDWELARGEYRHLALYPPRCADTGGLCCGAFTPWPWDIDLYLVSHAARLGLTYNGYGAARIDRPRWQAYCERLQADVMGGRLDPRTIYFVGGSIEGAFVKANPHATCRRLDGELACVAPKGPSRFRDRLASPR